MFVSGPVGTSVTGVAACGDGACDPARPRLETGSAVGGGSVGPSRPLSPWTCAATRSWALERLGRAGGHRHVGASGELEDAQGVRRGLFERLVAVRRRHAEQLELGARER